MTHPVEPSSRRAAVQTGVSLGAQALLIVLGLEIVLADDDATLNIVLLGIWCLLASVFSVATLVQLGRKARRPPVAHAPARLLLGRTARILTIVGTVLPSLIGVIAAGQVLASKDDQQAGPLFAVIGVWAMLVSWGLLHWGYAQIYLQRYHRSLALGMGPTLTFPATEHPRTVDFVYFSYTIGTAFATSDVVVLTTGARWLVTWHAVVGFFFNGLIIVFALSTILGR